MWSLVKSTGEVNNDRVQNFVQHILVPGAGAGTKFRSFANDSVRPV